MSVRSKVKVNARRAMSQNFIKTLSVTLVLVCVVFLYGIFVLTANWAAELFGKRLGLPSILSQWNYLLSAPVVAVSLIFQLILFSPLVLGAARWFYRMVGNEPSDIIDLFDFFSGIKRYFGSIWLEFILFLRRFVFAFLFLTIPLSVSVLGAMLVGGYWDDQVPGPVATLLGSMLVIAGGVLLFVASIFLWVFLKRYFLVRFLYSSGECTVRQAFKQSVYFMKGHKGELFLFDLTYLGWFVSCVLIVPLFYVAPYYCSASALYAKVLIERNRRSVPLSTMEQEPTMEFGPTQETNGEASEGTA